MYEAVMLLISLAGINFMALITPGPDFFLVTQVAVSQSRREAVMTVLGITLGVAIWAVVALLGLHVLVEKLPWIQTLLFLAGGCYLIYLGILLLKSSCRQLKSRKVRIEEMLENPLTDHQLVALDHKTMSGLSLFLKGLFTNLSNPKALIYFGSVFVMFVGGDISTILRIEIFTLVIVETFFWFLVVVILFSLPQMKALYQKAGAYIDGIAGIFFVIFGGGLLYQAAMQLLIG